MFTAKAALISNGDVAKAVNYVNVVRKRVALLICENEMFATIQCGGIWNNGY